MKTVFAIVLTLSMLFGIMTGCGSSQEPVTPPDGSASQGGTVVESGTDSGIPKHLAEIGYQPTGYPVVTKPITFTLAGITNPVYLGTAEDWKKNKFWIRMEEMTNVKFDFIKVISPEAWEEQKSIMMASQDLPDVFFQCKFSKQEEQKFGGQGLLMDIKPYITEEYIPNLVALDKQYPGLLKEITTPTGAIYSLPEITALLPKRAAENITVNKTWCKILGIDLPTDTESFYQMLKAFKTGDPNQNGKPDEIPMCVAGMSQLKFFTTMFGYIYGENGMFADDENQNIIYVPTTPEYKEYLKYFQKLYAEGLMDPDTFALTTNDVKAKGSAKDPLLGVIYTRSARTVVDGLSQLHPDGDIGNVDHIRLNDYEYVVLKAANGKQYCPANSNLATTGRCVVTSKCKYPEVFMRWMDYLYTQEGGTAVWMGREGKEFKIEDGVLKWLNEDGTVASDDKMLDIRKKAAIQMGGNQPGLRPDVVLKMELELVRMQEVVSDYIRPAMPSFYFEDSQVSELTALTADLNPYIEQFAANAITGNIDIDKEWDTFQNTIQQMGGERLRLIYQACLDRYMGK
ncbi:MAG: hypothetical protein GX211_00490 [Clostridiaceae bacterium]|jgi:putative aldouronate transport system substrate-binding protein|nr:hypothetical protein [Clostridiaceae bacterium]